MMVCSLQRYQVDMANISLEWRLGFTLVAMVCADPTLLLGDPISSRNGLLMALNFPAIGSLHRLLVFDFS